MYNRGDVIFDVAKNLINSAPKKKYHLCIDGTVGLFLYINSNQYEEDFPIKKLDCYGLPNFESYISVWKIIHKTDFFRKASIVCTVNAEFIDALLSHITTSPVVSDIDRTVLIGALT